MPTIDYVPGKRQGILGDTSSPQTFQQIQLWLEHCKHDHAGCAVDRTDRFLPTRLIDLTGWHKSQTLRLVESRTISRDVESLPVYTTLTYKWAADATAATSTNSSNLAARLMSLVPSDLPLLFLHAIEASHKLSVSYLWIDSLCILQDSKADFETEAAMMSKIYRHSYCTISAGLDDTDTLGLFRQQDVKNNAVEFELRDGNGEMRRVRALERQGK